MSTTLLESGDRGAMSVTRFAGDCANCGTRGVTFQITAPLPYEQAHVVGYVQLCAPCLGIAEAVARSG